MSFSGYMGFVTGLLLGGLLVVARMIIAKKKGVIESDEMTGLIRRRAAESSFLTLGAFSFGAWVVDNVRNHLDGGAVQFFSPWGIMIWATVCIYLVALMYHHWTITGRLIIDDKGKRVKAGLVLVATGTVIGVVQLTANPTFAPDLHPFFLAVELIFSGSGIALLLTTRKPRQQ